MVLVRRSGRPPLAMRKPPILSLALREPSGPRSCQGSQIFSRWRIEASKSSSSLAWWELRDTPSRWRCESQAAFAGNAEATSPFDCSTRTKRPSLVPQQFPYSSRTVPLRFPYSSPTVPLQFPYSSPAVPVQFPYNSPTVPAQFPYSSRTVPLQFPYSSPTVPLQFPYSSPTVPVQFPYSSPTDPNCRGTVAEL